MARWHLWTLVFVLKQWGICFWDRDAMRSQLELSAGKLQPGNAGYWTHLSSCSDEKMNTRFGTPRAKAQLWAALVPSTRHGLRQSGSSQNSQNYFTEMLFIFNCLSRVINLKSLFYTGLFHVFGVHSIIVHLFSQKPFCLYCWAPFPGPCSLEWAGQGGGCRQATAAQGK